MSTGDQRTFTIGTASGMPGQGVGTHSGSLPRQGIPGQYGSGAPVAGPARHEVPAVRLRRLAGVAAWALALVLAGVATAIVGLFKIFGDGEAWFTPAFISVGVVGMLLAMMAFATVRFRGVPWVFMTASSITLLAAYMMLRVA